LWTEFVWFMIGIGGSFILTC